MKALSTSILAIEEAKSPLRLGYVTREAPRPKRSPRPEGGISRKKENRQRPSNSPILRRLPLPLPLRRRHRQELQRGFAVS